MKKLLFIGLMGLLNVGAVTWNDYSKISRCTVHYTVVNNNGDVIWGPADITADNCQNAAKAARYFYFLNTGDTSVYQ